MGGKLPASVNLNDGLGGVMTLPEAATYLDVHPRTLQRALHRGQVPGVKVGRAWRLTKRRIDEYLRGPR